MPPKSSPVKPKTLGDFFIRDGSVTTAKSNIDSNSPTPTSTPETAANLSPEKSKAKRKSSKVKTKESSETKQPASTDSISTKKDTPKNDETPIKQSPKTKSKRSNSEFVTAVTVPIYSPKNKENHAKSSKEPENVPPPPLPVTDNTESTLSSKGGSNVSSVSTTSTTTALPTTTTTTTTTTSTLNGSASVISSTASKLNKIDTASMFKVRSGKAYITESKIKFSAHPAAISELCRFHEYREKLREAKDLSQYKGISLNGDHVEITRIPEEYNGLIAKLSEESDLLLTEMANNILAILCPTGFEAMEDVVPTNESDEKMDLDVDSSSGNEPTARNSSTVSISAITEVIQTVATRINYGVHVSSLPTYTTVTPPNLSVYRWEVQDIDQYFPSDMKSVVLKRRSKRMEASAALTAWYLGLEPKQQEDLCPIPINTSTVANTEAESLSGVKKNRSLNATENMEVDTETGKSADSGGVARSGVILLEGQPTVAAVLDPAVLEFKLKEAETKKKEAEAKEERRLEKERRLAEKQLEKDMKEAERIQKEELKKRKAEEERLKKEQTSMRFVGFFKPISSPVQKRDGLQSSTKADVAASTLSELFHPFHVKKDTTLAPINRFSKDISREAIDNELDSKEASGSCAKMDIDLDSYVPVMADKKKVRDHLSKLFPKTRVKESSSYVKKLPRQYRSMTVAEVVQSGVLLQDEDNDTNYMLTWRDIPSLRMRLLQFAENYRPAYYGTWSKQTKFVSGRRYLGKDTELIDYEFDSEAEWEEDEEGEECKSDDDEEDAEELGSDQDDEDDWLVPEGYLSEDEGLDAGEEGGLEGGSLKKLKEPRRATLAQMVPVIVGPAFEVTLGESTCHPALEPYRVEFIGDFGVGMDLYHATNDLTNS